MALADGVAGEALAGWLGADDVQAATASRDVVTPAAASSLVQQPGPGPVVPAETETGQLGHIPWVSWSSRFVHASAWCGRGPPASPVRRPEPPVQRPAAG